MIPSVETLPLGPRKDARRPLLLLPRNTFSTATVLVSI